MAGKISGFYSIEVFINKGGSISLSQADSPSGGIIDFPEHAADMVCKLIMACANEIRGEQGDSDELGAG